MTDPKTWLTASALALSALLAWLAVPAYGEFIGFAKIVVGGLWGVHLGSEVTAKVAQVRIAKMAGEGK